MHTRLWKQLRQSMGKKQYNAYNAIFVENKFMRCKPERSLVTGVTLGRGVGRECPDAHMQRRRAEGRG